MNALAADPGERLAACDGADCLICGIGNVGRQDDGLGWAFIDWLEESGAAGRAEVGRCYQLMLEDADRISRRRRVLFVDATKAADVAAWRVETVRPRMDTSFTSHAVSIPTIIATCRTCFGVAPQVQLLTIRGYAWNLEIGLTERAARNLRAAQQHFLSERRRHD